MKKGTIKMDRKKASIAILASIFALVFGGYYFANNSNKVSAKEEQKTTAPAKATKAVAGSTKVTYPEEWYTEGWEEMTMTETASVPLGNGSSLLYGFGNYRQTDVTIASLSNMDKIRSMRPTFNLKPDASQYPSYVMYNSYSGLVSSDNPELGIGFQTVYSGGTTAQAEANGKVINPKFYKKKTPSGLTAFRRSYDKTDYSKISTKKTVLSMNDYLIGYTSGYAELTTRYTNENAETMGGVTLAYMNNLTSGSTSTLRALGNNAGFYYKDDYIRMDFLLDDPGKDFSNWAVSNNTAYTSMTIDAFLKQPTLYYKSPDAPGMEALDSPAGTRYAGYLSTSPVYYGLFKKSGVDLAPGETISASYRTKMAFATTEPQVLLDKSTDTYTEDYELTGNWTDYNGETVDLYYQIGTGTPVKFASNQAASYPGASEPFSVTIPKAELGKKDQSVKVYAINASTLKSNEAVINLTYVAPPLTDPVISANLTVAPTSIRQGDAAVYTAVINNTAAAPTQWTGVNYTTTAFPVGVTPDAASVKINGKAVQGTFDAGTRVLSIPVGDVTAETTITYNVNTDTTAALGVVSQTFTVKGNEGTAVTSAKADLTIAARLNDPRTQTNFSVSPSEVRPGGVATYTADFKNVAEQPTQWTGVVYKTIAFPEGVTPDTATIKVNGVTAQGSFDTATRILTIAVGDVTTTQVTYDANIADNATAGVVSQTYTVKGNEGTESPAPTADLTILPKLNDPIISATLAAAPTSIRQGESTTYTAVINNTAPAPSSWTGVNYQTTAFPEGMTPDISTIKINGTAFTGQATFDTATRTLAIPIGDVTAETTITYQVNTVSSVAKGIVEQTYTVKGNEGAETVSNSVNVTIGSEFNEPIITTSLVAAPVQIRQGESTKYTAVINNTATAPTKWTDVNYQTIAFPEGMTPDINTIVVNGTAYAGQATFDSATRILTIPLGTVTEKTTITYGVNTVNTVGVGVVPQTFTVKGNEGNEATSAKAEVTIISEFNEPVLSGTLNVAPTQISQGKVATYTATLTNSASAPSQWTGITYQTVAFPTGVTPKLDSVVVDGINQAANASFDEATRILTIKIDKVVTSTKITYDVQTAADVATGVVSQTFTAKGNEGNEVTSPKADLTIIPAVNSVTIRYLMDETNNTIAPQEEKDGQYGAAFSFPSKSITGYALSYILVDGVKQATLTDPVVGKYGEVSTIDFVYAGQRFLQSAPTILDFGLEAVSDYKNIRVDNPTYDQPLVVTDNQGTLKSWTLTAKLTQPLTNLEDTKMVLNDALRYKEGAKEMVLDSSAQAIVTHTNTTQGSYNISDTWAPTGDGFKMEIPAGGINKLGKYRAVILFELGDTP